MLDREKSNQGNYVDFQVGPDEHGYLRLFIRGRVQNRATTIRANTTLVVDSRWHLIIITRDNNTINCYVDGVTQGLKFYDSVGEYKPEAEYLLQPIDSSNLTNSKVLLCARKTYDSSTNTNKLVDYTEAEMSYLKIYNQALDSEFRSVLQDNFSIRLNYIS